MDSPWKISNDRLRSTLRTPAPVRKQSDDDMGLFWQGSAARPPPRSAEPQATISKPMKRRLTESSSSSPLPAMTPSAPKKQALATLSFPVLSSRPPQTPAETERYLKHQAESMTKLSIRDDDTPYIFGVSKGKERQATPPTHIPKHRARRRSSDRHTLSRAAAGIFESAQDTPLAPPSFAVFATERRAGVQARRLQSSATLFFGPTIPSPTPKSRPNTTSVVPEGFKRPMPSSSPVVTSPVIPRKFKPRDSGIGGIDSDDETQDVLLPMSAKFATDQQDSDDGLVTPSIVPSVASNWPMLASRERRDVQKQANAHARQGLHHMPDTPVKRSAVTRTWLSTTKKVVPTKLRNAPRKSLPLSFPNLSSANKYGSAAAATRVHLELTGNGDTGGLSSSSSSEDACAGRSSSSSDESVLNTPTRPKDNGLEWLSPVTPPRWAQKSSAESVPRLQPSSADEAPGRFERDFLVVGKMGEGVFGTVAKVRHKEGNTSAVFAVKRSKPFEGLRDRLRLREEVNILQLLASAAGPTGHPNVLRYVDSWEQDQMLYIETELCEYGSFGQFLYDYGTIRDRLDEGRVWKVIADLSDGLKFIHSCGIIHLDLKPANIFVAGDGKLRIGDFGMATLWPRPSGTEAGFEREGDRDYMAPEVLQGIYGPAADIFSFGMIVLETAGNIVVPDMGDAWQKLRQDDFSGVDMALFSAELVELMRAMMRSAPEGRPDIAMIYSHRVVIRARAVMERRRGDALADGRSSLVCSPLYGEEDEFLEELLGPDEMRTL